MSENQLPPVAKSFNTFCKKCDADRYHTVLAHTTATTAKIECEVCHSKKSYSIKTKTAKGPNSGLVKATAARRAASENARRSSHNAEYEALMESAGGSKEVIYNIRTKFEKNQKMNHPKFGIGVIRDVQPEKIEVIFPDEVRNLVHNRQ